MQNLGYLPGSFQLGYANALNSTGQVVGTSYVSNIHYHGFLWTSATGIQDLGTLSDGGNSEAKAINDNGQIVGITDVGTTHHAFAWTSAGGMKDLDAMSGAASSAAYGINNHGQIVGTSDTTATIWSSGQKTLDLNTVLDASGKDWHLTAANAINDAGQIVGYGQNPDQAEHPFLLTPVPKIGDMNGNGARSIISTSRHSSWP